MSFDRRQVLAAVPAALATGGLAQGAWSAEAPAPLAAYERASGGRIGVYAENLATGAKLAWRADERFVMCSTFKASLAGCVLSRVDHGKERLDARLSYSRGELMDYAPFAQASLAKGSMSVEEACRAAVELSDNTCANLLLARIGGPAALTAFWRSIGDATSRLDHNEPVLNRSPPGDPHDTTTPAAMAGTIRRLTLGDALTPASRRRLTDWMLACQTGLNLVRAGLPAGWRVADKTGNNGRDARGDLVVAWPRAERPMLICVYLQGGRPSAALQETTFAEVGRLAARTLA